MDILDEVKQNIDEVFIDVSSTAAASRGTASSAMPIPIDYYRCITPRRYEKLNTPQLR